MQDTRSGGEPAAASVLQDQDSEALGPTMSQPTLDSGPEQLRRSSASNASHRKPFFLESRLGNLGRSLGKSVLKEGERGKDDESGARSLEQAKGQGSSTGRTVSGRVLYGRSYRLGGNLDAESEHRSPLTTAMSSNSRKERHTDSVDGGGGDMAVLGTSVRDRSAELGAAAMEYSLRQRALSPTESSSPPQDSKQQAKKANVKSPLSKEAATTASTSILDRADSFAQEDGAPSSRSVVRTFEPDTSPNEIRAMTTLSSSVSSDAGKTSPRLGSSGRSPTSTRERDPSVPSALSVMIQRHTPTGSRNSSRSNSVTRLGFDPTSKSTATIPSNIDFQDSFLRQPRKPLFPRTRSRDSLHNRSDTIEQNDRPLLATPEDEASAMKELRRRDKAKYGHLAKTFNRWSDNAGPAPQRSQPLPNEGALRDENDVPMDRPTHAGGINPRLEEIPEERSLQGGNVSLFDKIFNYATKKGGAPSDELPPLLLADENAERSSHRRYSTFDDDHLSPSISLSKFSKPGRSPKRGPSFLSRRVAKTKYMMKSLPNSMLSDLSFAQVVKAPISCLPAVVLGTLLNILDGVSYGMITFPTNLAIFSTFGGDGVSMYFISCIVSQLVYSWGGSAFVGGNGTMMIEIVPFLHIIAEIIIDDVGSENVHTIRATTMVAFALSSVLTGLVFLLMGALRLGALIGFFPRHILVGCIGGVGVFLFVTGIEVSARLQENLAVNLGMLKLLFGNTHVLSLWTIPLGLAILLRLITYKVDHPLVTPAYFLAVPIIFYIVKFGASLDLLTLRQSGWIFDVKDEGIPWYHFYSYFDLGATDWGAIASTIPSQLALVFFGILHVPINVPALGVSLQQDDINTDRELVAHGVSNLLSGIVGSVPNYLCYVNSVLFYRVNGDSRLAGTMLAGSTVIVMLLGPGVIGYIPVCVVGALIFLLGMDLIKEAVWDTWGKTDWMETLTIWAIIIAMTYWDFVIGIGVGIVLACFFFVVMTSRRQAIRASYSGDKAKSTVRRHITQRTFLRAVGKQILILKLQGFLFFGTISSVEDKISQTLDLASWQHNPIRFLVLDMALVYGVDFSAAEAFLRIKRLLRTRNVIFVLSGCRHSSATGKALRTAGIWQDALNDESPLQAFSDLNESLEWCENMLLRQLYAVKGQNDSDFTVRGTLPVSLAGVNEEHSSYQPPHHHPLLANEINELENSPRRSHIREAARNTFKYHDEHISKETLDTEQQPVPLLMQIFSAYGKDDQGLFKTIAPFFKRIEVAPGSVLFKEGDRSHAMYLIESGMLRAAYTFADRVVVEAMLPGCVAGDMSFISGTERNAAVQAERKSVLWMLDEEGKANISRLGAETFETFVSMILRCSADEQDALLQYLTTVLA